MEKLSYNLGIEWTTFYDGLNLIEFDSKQACLMAINFNYPSRWEKCNFRNYFPSEMQGKMLFSKLSEFHIFHIKYHYIDSSTDYTGFWKLISKSDNSSIICIQLLEIFVEVNLLYTRWQKLKKKKYCFSRILEKSHFNTKEKGCGPHKIGK